MGRCDFHCSVLFFFFYIIIIIGDFFPIYEYYQQAGRCTFNGRAWIFIVLEIFQDNFYVCTWRYIAEYKHTPSYNMITLYYYIVCMAVEIWGNRFAGIKNYIYLHVQVPKLYITLYVYNTIAVCNKYYSCKNIWRWEILLRKKKSRNKSTWL